MNRDYDNRDTAEMYKYHEASMKALRTRVKELESALRFVLALEDTAPLDNIREFIRRPA